MDRLDEMSRILRETAAESEALRAAATGMQARIAALEGQLAESQAVQMRLAETVEHFRGELGRIGVVERNLAQQNEERQRQIDQVSDALRRALSDTAHRLEVQIQQAGREYGPYEPRIAALEGLPDQIAALQHQRNTLGDAVSALAARIDASAGERQAVEEAARQREAREHAHMTELQRQVVAFEQAVGTWQARIEGQAETLREARAIAESMVGEVQSLQRSQHEVAEAQRVWETRLESLLAQWQADSDERWRAFLVERGHDWRRLEDQHGAIDERLRGHEARMDELATALRENDEVARAATDIQEAAIVALRRQLVEILSDLGRHVDEIAGELESGLPFAERPSVAEDRRLALRREVRARRGHQED